jgi:hypothetical protein
MPASPAAPRRPRTRLPTRRASRGRVVTTVRITSSLISIGMVRRASASGCAQLHRVDLRAGSAARSVDLDGIRLEEQPRRQRRFPRRAACEHVRGDEKATRRVELEVRGDHHHPRSSTRLLAMLSASAACQVLPPRSPVPSRSADNFWNRMSSSSAGHRPRATRRSACR